MYRLMVQTRVFEETVESLNKQKRSLGSIHTSIGEEATAIGVGTSLREADILSPSYRDTGMLFCKGFSVLELMGMAFGKEVGATQGRTRLLHVGDLDRNILPGNPILGASSAIAVGAALAIKKKGEKRIVVNVFGDGASNEGAVHESMNFAAAFGLPIVFVIVNNQYAWSTPTSKMLHISSLADRAKAYGFPGFVANGNDVLEVRDVLETACNWPRQGSGPALVECRTYRVAGHSGNDKNAYRSEEEILRWKQDCPIEKFGGYLCAIGLIDEAEIESIWREIWEEVDASIALAESSPYPKPEKLLDPRAMLFMK
jgi:pyruvate dehydrogenase E1 component alpha subunit